MDLKVKAKAFLAALFVLNPCGSAVFAQEQDDSASVDFPGPPPLDEENVYEVRREFLGEPALPPSTARQSVRYTMQDDRLILRVETQSVETAAGEFVNDGSFVLPAGDIRSVFALLSPISLAVNETGALDRVADWTGYQASVRIAINEQLGFLPEADRDDARQFFTQVSDAQFSQGPEGSLLTLADPWVSFLGARPHAAVPGQVYITEFQYAPFGGTVPVTSRNIDRMDILADGAIQLTREQHVDQAEFAQAIDAFNQNNSPQGAELSEEERQGNIDEMSQSLRSSELVQIVETDGTLRSARWQVNVTSMQDGTLLSGNVVTITRVANEQEPDD